ncbi:MAG: hypothetical protein ACLSUZ_05970 [Bifidobacterium pseudocatenulatum]
MRRAVAGIAEAKEWAWNEALHNDELTNMQLESVARGFASTPRSTWLNRMRPSISRLLTGFGEQDLPHG